MATKILLKKSVTGGSSPLTSDLEQGELAVNLVDKKIYTKDAGNNISRLDGAYVDSVAPANPVEGDLWYDTTNNLLKAYDGSAFQSAGYQNLSDLEDVTLTSIATDEYLKWSGTAFVNSNLETDVEALLSATNTGTGHGDLSYANGVYTFDRVTAAEIRGELSQGTGVTYNSTTGEIAIGQAVETTSDVTFNDVSIDGQLTVADPIITLHDANTSTPAGNAGITVYRGGVEPDKSLLWDEANDKWTFGSETLVVGNIEGTIAGNTTGNLTGDVLADDNTNVILQNGTDGTDAVFTGSVVGTVSDISNHDTSDLAEDPAATTTSGTMYFTEGRARDALSGGTGVTYTAATGVIAIGQEVETTSDVTFNKVVTDLIEGGSVITIDPAGTGDATGDVIIAGSLTVQGTTTSVNSNEVNIGDSIILLNSDETGTPSQNAGFEIERGTEANKSFLWNEADDKWSLENEELYNVIIDGGSY